MIYEGPFVVLKAVDGRWELPNRSSVQYSDLFLLLQDEDKCIGGRLFGKRADFTGAKGFRYYGKVHTKTGKYGEQIHKITDYITMKKIKTMLEMVKREIEQNGLEFGICLTIIQLEDLGRLTQEEVRDLDRFLSAKLPPQNIEHQGLRYSWPPGDKEARLRFLEELIKKQR